MIDEKKINKAMSTYAMDTWNHIEERFAAMNGFKEGAEWAQKEFVKSLWHDTSEEPKRYDDYLVRTIQGCIDFCHFNMNGWNEPKVGGGQVSQWLDLADILPKEGGEE